MAVTRVIKVTPPETIEGLNELFGGSLKIVVHRDRDFMMAEEVNALAKPYQDKGFRMWFTRCSDIESYWAVPEVIASHFNQNLEDAKLLLEDAVMSACTGDEALKTRRKKRADTINQIKAISKGELPQFGDKEVEDESTSHGSQYRVLGKDLIAKIRDIAQNKKMAGAQTFGKNVPHLLEKKIAEDLYDLLKSLLT